MPFHLSRGLSWRLITIFSGLALGIGIAGYLFYSAQENRMEEAQEDELQSIANSKADQIAAWRRERLADAHLIAENGISTSIIRAWLRNRTSASLTEDLRKWMGLFMDTEEYKNIHLLDQNDRAAMSSVASGLFLAPQSLALVQKARDSGIVMFSDIHQDSAVMLPHMDIFIPMFDTSAFGRPPTFVGTMVLDIDPAVLLFPLVESWPSQRRTLETIMVSRDNDHVVYLSRLRNQKTDVPSLRLPVSQADLPAGQAVQGREGIIRGTDYRGIPVVAAAKRVADSPWYIVAKIDREEIFSDARKRGASIAAVTLVLIVAAGFGTIAEWRRQGTRHLLRLIDAETEKKALTRHYEYLTKYANDIIIMSDERGQIQEVNDKALSSYDYTLDEMLGLTLSDLVASGGEKPAQRRTEETGSSNGAIFEAVHRRKDGSLFPVEVSARKISIDGRDFFQSIVRDITDRKRAEQALQKSEEHFRTLIENASVGACMVDLQGRFVAVNQALCDYLGYTEEELRRFAFNDVTYPEDREAGTEGVRRVVSGEIERYTLEKRYVRKDGGIVWGIVSFSLIRDREGKPEYFVTNVQDITQRKAAEEQIVSSLREKEILLKEIHHRVKNNMQVISSLLNLGNLRIADPGAKAILHDSMNRIRSMALVHEALYRSANMADIDFSEYLRTVTSWLLRSAGRDGIRCTVEGEDIHLSVDMAIPCGLIVNELVSNALKHAFPDRSEGSIAVALETPAKGRIAIRVQDDGVGMPPGADPRTMSSMGMTLVASLVDQISGTLTMECRKGTAIVVSFPV